MVLNDILLILNNDSELKTLVSGVYAFGTDVIPSIVYEYSELTNNKVVGQARLTLTIITKDYEINQKAYKRVKQLLLTLGDEKLNNEILEIALNGGGTLYNKESSTIHNKAIFIVKFKESR